MMEIEILIATMGTNIHRVHKVLMPPHEGVCYLVSWQRAGCTDAVPAMLLGRRDVRVKVLEGVGLSRNRNNLILNAKGAVCFIADDDLTYDMAGVLAVAERFAADQSLDYVTFRYRSEKYPKRYPEEEFDFPNVPRNYFVTSFEIAFRLSSVRSRRVLFDERYGLGAPVLHSAEEQVWLDDAARAGLRGRYLPIEVVTHNGPTTSVTRLNDDGVVMAEGAYIRRRFRGAPWQWMLRLPLKAWRMHKQSHRPFAELLRLVLSGAKMESGR